MEDMRQYLLDALRQANEADYINLPNVVFLTLLKEQLEEQFQAHFLHDSPWTKSELIDVCIANFNVNFAALGLETSEEDKEFLLELATLTAASICKMYKSIVPLLGSDVFLGQLKGFNLSLT